MATSKPAPRKASTVTDSKNADDKQSDTGSPNPTPPVASKPAQQAPPNPTLEPADENTAKHEASDLEAAMSRHTFDGKGDNAVPPPDFQGFATAGVEKNRLKPLDDVVQDVLNGNYGTTAEVVVERLYNAGYTNLDEIEAAYNKRVKAGAPKAF